MPEILNKEVYERVASDLDDMKLNLAKAKDLRDTLKEVREETTELDATIRDLEQKIGRWYSMLKRRGFVD